MKKKILTIICMMVLLTVFSGCGSNKNAEYRADGFYLDTYVSVCIYGEGSDRIARDTVDLCAEYEKIFNCRDEESLLSRLNKAQSMSMEDEQEKQLLKAIEEGIYYGRLTEGALDITLCPLTTLWNFKEAEVVPDAGLIEKALENTGYDRITIKDNEVNLNGTTIDLGAVAKGYIADEMTQYLKSQGVTSALINLGGNIYCMGSKPDGSDFTIGIQYPFKEGSQVIETVKLKNKSVVTSGVYERYFYKDDILYHHILEPKTGYPVKNGLLSVTIIADDSITCDCLSTGCFVMGKDKAMELLNNMEGVYGIFVDEDYNVFYSEGAETYVK